MQATLPALSFDGALLQDQARALTTVLARALRDHDEAVFDYDVENRVEEIESTARDGFWPWTSGGFNVTLAASLAHHWGTGSAPAPLQPMLDSGAAIIAEEWDRQHPDQPFDKAVAGELGPEVEAKAQEWESEGWMSDDDAYFWKARVMFLAPDDMSYRSEEAPEPGEPYVYVDAYLNTDLNYGRDHIRWLSAYGSSPNQTSGDFKRVYTLDRFAALTDDDMENLAVEAMKELP